MYVSICMYVITFQKENLIEWFRKAELALFFKNALIYLGLNFTLKIPVSEITHP